MEPSPSGTPPKARTVNLWRYVVIVYFLICGGPFGIEVAVSAAGPLPTLIGFFAMPFLWSFPQVWAVLPTAAGACALAYTHLTRWPVGAGCMHASLYVIAHTLALTPPSVCVGGAGRVQRNWCGYNGPLV